MDPLYTHKSVNQTQLQAYFEINIVIPDTARHCRYCKMLCISESVHLRSWLNMIDIKRVELQNKSALKIVQ